IWFGRPRAQDGQAEAVAAILCIIADTTEPCLLDPLFNGFVLALQFQKKHGSGGREPTAGSRPFRCHIPAGDDLRTLDGDGFELELYTRLLMLLAEPCRTIAFREVRGGEQEETAAFLCYNLLFQLIGTRW